MKDIITGRAEATFPYERIVNDPRCIENRRREAFFTNPSEDFDVRQKELDGMPDSFFKAHVDMFADVLDAMRELGCKLKREDLPDLIPLLRRKGIAAKHIISDRYMLNRGVMTTYDYEKLVGKPYDPR